MAFLGYVSTRNKRNVTPKYFFNVREGQGEIDSGLAKALFVHLCVIEEPCPVRKATIFKKKESVPGAAIIRKIFHSLGLSFRSDISSRT